MIGESDALSSCARLDRRLAAAHAERLGMAAAVAAQAVDVHRVLIKGNQLEIHLPYLAMGDGGPSAMFETSRCLMGGGGKPYGGGGCST